MRNVFDKVDESKGRIYKAIDTWLTKIYIAKITQYVEEKYYFVNISSCLSFMLGIYGKTKADKDKLAPIIVSYAKKAKNTITTKLKRVNKHPNIIELQRKYPNLDILSAYKFMVLKEKSKISKSDIKDFETLIDILSKQALKSKKQ